MKLQHLVVCILVVAASLVSATARAEDFHTCFEEGKRQLEAAKWSDACATFERCEGIAGVTLKTRYQLGRCNEEAGKFASAYKAFTDAARLATQEKDHKRAEVARQRARELEEKVARIRINIAPAALGIEGLEVTRNGEPVPKADWNRTLAVDPGEHAVVASAPGRKRVSRTIANAASGGDVKDVTIPPLAVGQDDAAEEPAAVGPVADPPTSDAAPAAGGDAGAETVMNNKALFWTGFGLTIAGGLAVAGGGVLLGIGERPKEESIGIMVAGGVLLAVGIPFLIVGGKQVPAEEARIEPWLSPTGGGLRVRF